MSQGMISLVLCAIVGLMILIYVFLWLKESDKFGEYYEQLDDNDCKSIIFITFYFLTGPLIGSINYLLYDSQFSIVLVMLYTFILFIITLLTTIFKKVRDRTRIQMNLIIIILTNIPYLIVQLNPNYSYDQSTNV